MLYGERCPDSDHHYWEEPLTEFKQAIETYGNVPGLRHLVTRLTRERKKRSPITHGSPSKSRRRQIREATAQT